MSPECSLEYLHTKLQYSGHLMQGADSLEKTLILGRILEKTLILTGGEGDDRG